MIYSNGYCLAVLGGNQEPEAEDITSILSSLGIESDVNKAKEIVQAIDGCKIKDLIATETVSQAKNIQGTNGYGILERR